jgi:predicted ribosome quality control (RQC) complex YloA/Tae2 family protein
VLAEQIEKGKAELSYLESVLDSVNRAETERELSQIREELTEQGYLRRPKGKAQKQAQLPPKEFLSSDGFRILVGRNNRQNDSLTGSAERNELWFHIKGFHGSHVILTPNGNDEPSDRDYTEAAMLAAYYSEKRGSANVEVDYTRVRNLKKPAGSAPGFVTYEKYYSAVVNAENPFADK